MSRSPFFHAALIGVLFAGGNAASDPTPRSLRMRHVRVAQSPDPAPAPPSLGESATQAPVPVPEPDTQAVDTISDEQLAKFVEEEESKGEVITVTGSTLQRRELTTPAPVTVMDKDDLDGAGLTTLGDILQDMPAQSNGINAQTNNGNTGATRIDVRGLGARPTLVLLNGRRVVPGGTGADSSVDINSIPLAVIERVEVLKDGASAIYGSEAIGGVVNVITRDDFQGTEVALYTGAAQKGE